MSASLDLAAGDSTNWRCFFAHSFANATATERSFANARCLPLRMASGGWPRRAGMTDGGELLDSVWGVPSHGMLGAD
jgi:hypothetical protein